MGEDNACLEWSNSLYKQVIFIDKSNKQWFIVWKQIISCFIKKNAFLNVDMLVQKTLNLLVICNYRVALLLKNLWSSYAIIFMLLWLLDKIIEIYCLV